MKKVRKTCSLILISVSNGVKSHLSPQSLEMGATSNTSSLLSSPSSSRHNHQRRSGPSGSTSRFGLTSVRRVCTTNLKNNRHNVAIATQVLSPKALSTQGSINRRRFRHFGGAESDDEEFFRRSKRRALLEKLFCYGVSITVILLVMTGVVLAVGYMQSEKQRISSRSVKLAQEQRLRSSNVITTQEPPQIVLAKTTVRPPTTTESMSPSKEGLSIADLAVDVDDDMDELQILEPPAEILKEIMEARSNERKGKFLDEEESKHRLPSEVKVLPPDGFTFDGYSFEFPIVRPPTSNATQLEKTTIASVNISIDPVDHDEESFNSSPTVVNANKDFSLSGFNFSIDKFPLGNFSGDFGTLSHSDGKGNMDIPVVAKLQTDLFSDDEESDNESSASNKSRNHPQIPTPTEHDGTYTPRPSSVVRYRDKPPRPSSRPYNKANQNRNSQDKGKLNSYNSISSPNEETTTTYSNLIDVSTSAPVKIEKFDFKTPVPGITDFKFDFTTPTPEVVDYLGLNKPETKFNLPTTTSNYDFSQQATTTNYNNVDYTHLLTTTPATTATIASTQDNQFSKRTYPGFDNFDSSTASTDVNPYAHFLKPFNPAGYLGSASPVGALQNFQQPSYNFDNNFDSSYNTPHSIPSGTIPLDLAASYIQAGNPPKLQNSGSSGNYGSGGDSFSYNPTLALSSLIQNGAGQSSGDSKNPNYNTISQGIHLLSLLSGNIPQHLLNGHDQLQSASHIDAQQQQHIAKPEYQIAALTGYGGSSNAFLSGLNTNPSGNGGQGHENYFHAESRSLPSYSSDLHQTKSFSSANNHVLDQLPSASSSSFSQDIISKISDFGASAKGLDDGKSHIAPPTPVSSTISEALANQPKSLSLDIIPRSSLREIESSLLDSFSAAGDKKLEKTAKILSAESASRKKDAADLNSDSPIVDFLRSDLETAGSEIHTITKKPYEKGYKSLFSKGVSTSQVKPQPFGRKLVIKTIKIKDDIQQKEIKERGLRSGFYF